MYQSFQRIQRKTVNTVINYRKDVRTMEELLQQLAEASKGLNEGELKELLENELNISFEKLVKDNPSVIAKEALYAGLNAAVISLVISIAPVLLNA